MPYPHGSHSNDPGCRDTVLRYQVLARHVLVSLPSICHGDCRW